MNYIVNKEEKYNILCLKESKLTSSISPDFKTQIISLTEDKKSIICDIEEVDYIDSSGLSCFLIGYRLLKKNNCKFIICSPSKKVKNLIKLTKLDTIFTCIESLQEAKDFIVFDELEKTL